jgi:hypothetical protein
VIPVNEGFSLGFCAPGSLCLLLDSTRKGADEVGRKMNSEKGNLLLRTSPFYALTALRFLRDPPSFFFSSHFILLLPPQAISHPVVLCSSSYIIALSVGPYLRDSEKSSPPSSFVHRR